MTMTMTPDRVGLLTSREREVLELMAEGLTNAGIAARLVLTERTVESHARSVFMKLDLHGDGAGHRRVLAVLSYLASSELGDAMIALVDSAAMRAAV
jgi:DNA-binding NarL/FixJ family response regulator